MYQAMSRIILSNIAELFFAHRLKLVVFLRRGLFGYVKADLVLADLTPNTEGKAEHSKLCNTVSCCKESSGKGQ